MRAAEKACFLLSDLIGYSNNPIPSLSRIVNISLAIGVSPTNPKLWRFFLQVCGSPQVVFH